MKKGCEGRERQGIREREGCAKGGKGKIRERWRIEKMLRRDNRRSKRR